jgi:hypothetical protein
MNVGHLVEKFLDLVVIKITASGALSDLEERLVELDFKAVHMATTRASSKVELSEDGSSNSWDSAEELYGLDRGFFLVSEAHLRTLPGSSE